MINLKLIKPTIEYKEQVLITAQEFIDNNSDFHWTSSLKKFLDNYEWRLDLLDKREHKETIDDWHAPWKQFLLIREFDNKLLWFINIRLELNEALFSYGWHIWYAIRPEERKKHYATAQLFSVLDIYDNMWIEKVLVVCNKVNVWSSKTIQKCWWILENEIIDPSDGELIQRYWIDVRQGIKKRGKFLEDNGFNIEII